MHALVHFRLPDGSLTPLAPGEIIGRAWSAGLRLDDPGISEAHALISLRGSALKLLALRGRFLVDGQPSMETELAAGQAIRVSRESTLLVDSVTLPEEVLALEGEGLARQVLTGTCSLFCLPTPRLVAGSDHNADAQLWSDGATWRLRFSGSARALLPGERFEVRGRRFDAVAVPLSQAAQVRTHRSETVDEPLRIHASYDTVRVLRDGRPPLLLSGQSALVISELVAAAGPLSWELIASQIWRAPIDRDALRRKWDVCLVRLRNRLREADLRADLIVSSGGQVELLLMEKDQVLDNT